MKTQDLLKAVKTAKKFTEKRSTMPILTRINLVFGPDCLKVQATNLEAAFEQVFKVKSENIGAGAVDAGRLIMLLESIGDTVDPLFIDNKVMMGQYELDCEEFPILPVVSEVTSAPAGFIDLLDSVMHATSEDPTRYHLNGVYLEYLKNTIRATATDGHRLAHNVLKDRDDSAFTFNGILCAHSLNKVLPLFKGSYYVGRASNNYFVLTDDTGLTCYVRIVEGRYPNYVQFIPAKFAHEIKIEKDKLLKLCKYIEKGTDKKSKAAVFTLTGEKLVFNNCREQWTKPKKKSDPVERLPDLPSFEGDIPVKAQVSLNQKIKLNLGYLIDALKNCPEDKIEMQIIDRLSPVGIEAKGFKAIVMPMR